MGSGSPRRGTNRPVVGGMSKSGRPTIACPKQGELPAVPGKGVEEGVGGRLLPSGSRLVLTTKDGVTLAVASSSPEADTVRDCIRDGLAYHGKLGEFDGLWKIRFQETR
jgi:hypothetical protein